MEIIQVDPANRGQVREFLRLPERIYRDFPQWVPALQGEDRARLDMKRYPFHQHSSAAFLLAREGDQPLARLAVLDNRPYNEYNHEKTAFFTLFESVADPQPAALLFERAFDWARRRGLDRIFGPKGFTALDGLGLLVKGFELRPALGIPYNPPYYPSLIEAQGFEKAGDIASGYLPADLQFPARIHELAQRIQERRGLRIARFTSRRELRHALGHLKTLYNGALEGTSGGTPISDRELRSLADQLLWFADPALIKIVMKVEPDRPGVEQPVGFLLAYPDISAALQKTRGRLFPFGWWTILRELKRTQWININGAGMLPAYRGLGGTAILYDEMFQSVAQNPRYRHAEVVQIGVENDRMQREMENFGVDFYKLHRTYVRRL